MSMFKTCVDPGKNGTNLCQFGRQGSFNGKSMISFPWIDGLKTIDACQIRFFESVFDNKTLIAFFEIKFCTNNVGDDHEAVKLWNCLSVIVASIVERECGFTDVGESKNSI